MLLHPSDICPKCEEVRSVHTVVCRYDGWENFETYSINLWLAKDSSYWIEKAEKAIKLDSEDERSASDVLAGWLKEWTEKQAPELGASVYADLLEAAFSSINWYEIAESMIEDTPVR